MYILHCIVLHLILSHLFCRSINKLQIKIKMSNPQALLNNHFPTRIPVNKEIRDFYERSYMYPQLVPGTLHVAGTCSELVFCQVLTQNWYFFMYSRFSRPNLKELVMPGTEIIEVTLFEAAFQ